MSSPLGEVLLKFRVNTAPLDQSLAKLKTKIGKFASSIKMETKGTSFFRDLEGGLKKAAAKFGKEIADQTKKGLAQAKKPTGKAASFVGSVAKNVSSKAYQFAVDNAQQAYISAYANKSKMDSRYKANVAKLYRSRATMDRQDAAIDALKKGIARAQSFVANPNISSVSKRDAYNKIARNTAQIAVRQSIFRSAKKEQDDAKADINATWQKRRQATQKFRQASVTKGFVDFAGSAASNIYSRINKTVTNVAPKMMSVAIAAAKTGINFISWLNPLGIVLNIFDGILNLGLNIASVALDIGKSLLTAGAYAGIALVGIAGYFTKIAGEEEAAITNIIRVAGIGIDAAGKLRESLLGVSSRSGGVSVGEVNKLAEFGARMGVGTGLSDKGKTDALAKFATDLSEIRMALDDIPIEEAATKISRILNVFQIGIDKTSNFASALVKLDNASTATGRDILEITRRISGTGSALGITVQETMALAAAMRDVGIDIEVGGTSIQNFFVRMSSDLNNFAKTLKIPKEELKNLIDTKPMEAMRLVLKKLSEYSARDQATLFTKLHLQGQRMTSTIWQLVKGFGKFDELLGYSVKEWESLEAIEQAVEMKNKTLWVSMQKVWNQLNALGIEIGTRLLPIAKELIAGLGDLITMLSNVAKANNYFEEFSNKVTSYIRMMRVLASDTDFALSYISAIWEETFMNIQNALGWVASSVQKAFEYIFEVMTRSLVWVGQRLKDPAQALGELIGTSIAEGLKDTIKGTLGLDIDQTILDVLDKVNAPEPIKALFKAVAKSQDEGTVKIQKAQDKLNNALGGMFDAKAIQGLRDSMPGFPEFGTIAEDVAARKLRMSISKNPADREKLKKWNEQEQRIKENADFKRVEMFVRTKKLEEKEIEKGKPIARPKDLMGTAVALAKQAEATKKDYIAPRDITKQAHDLANASISKTQDIFASQYTSSSKERMASTENWKYRESSGDFYPIWKDGTGRTNGKRNSNTYHQAAEERYGTEKILSKSSVERIEAAKEAARKVAENTEKMKAAGYVPGMKGEKNAEAFKKFRELGGFTPSKGMQNEAAKGRAIVAREAADKAEGELIAKAFGEKTEEMMGDKSGKHVGAFGFGGLGMAPGLAEAALKIKEDIAKQARPNVPTQRLRDLRDDGYKPEFFGLEEFSRKIQTGLFDKKNEDPQMRMANVMEELKKDQDNWKKNEGKKMLDDVGALAQMGRNGQLGGLLMA